MAGEWIKWTKGLPDKPEVLRISGLLKLSRAEVVVRLMRFWEWCDENIGLEAIGENGSAVIEMSPLDGDNCAFIDSLVWTTGFSDSLKSVGWLRIGGGRIELPNFGRHNGKTAKTRARNAKTQQNKRGNGSGDTEGKTGPVDGDSVTKMSPRDGDKKVTREEKSIRDANASLATASPPKEKRPRNRDELFDAIAEVTASDPNVSASFIGSVAADLRKGDPPYTPEEVRDFGERFKKLCKWAIDQGRDRPELGEVHKYIGKVRAIPPPKASTPGDSFAATNATYAPAGMSP